MSSRGSDWFNSLKDHISTRLVAEPLPVMGGLSAADLARCRLQGGTLIAWLERHSPRLLQERAMFSHLEGNDPRPFIVVLSDVTGLVAAEEIVGESNRLAFLKRSEFEAFTTEHPDDELKWHVRFVNEITVPSGIMAEKAAIEFPLLVGEEYWLHIEESIMGPLFARGFKHLLKWDGINISVLKEGFSCWIS